MIECYPFQWIRGYPVQLGEDRARFPEVHFARTEECVIAATQLTADISNAPIVVSHGIKERTSEEV